jgi:hypothetical protein
MQKVGRGRNFQRWQLFTQREQSQSRAKLPDVPSASFLHRRKDRHQFYGLAGSTFRRTSNDHASLDPRPGLSDPAGQQDREYDYDGGND